MRKITVFSLLLSLAVLLTISCDRIPIGTGPVGASTPTSDGSGSKGTEVLSQAVQKLNQVDSFKFKIDMSYNWTYEGQDQDWPFTGEGAWAKNDRFYSFLSGPADTELIFRIIDGNSQCEDTRGTIADCPKSFGSIGYGSSPYTAIAYLKNYGTVADPTVKSLEGNDYYSIGFAPKLDKVASLDTGHAQALQKVSGVEGEVLIDKKDLTLKQETVKVKFVAATGATEIVSTTLTFYDYNKPVEIK